MPEPIPIPQIRSVHLEHWPGGQQSNILQAQRQGAKEWKIFYHPVPSKWARFFQVQYFINDKLASDVMYHESRGIAAVLKWEGSF